METVHERVRASQQAFLINFKMTSREFAEWLLIFEMSHDLTLCIGGLFIDMGWK